MVAGAAGPQDSTGDLTNQASAQGIDITEGTRQGAQTPIGSNPMQSPELGQQGGFALRYGVGFLCINYTTMPRLSDIQGYAQPTSTYRRAFQGMNRSEQYTDPRSSVIRTKITDWTSQIARALPPGRAGELVVSFQGHGQNGGIFGVDGVLITTAELTGFANQAERQRVSITYILDSCGSGNAVPAFQERTTNQVQGQVGNVEGRGNQSSEENHAAAAAVQEQLTAVRELIAMNRHLGSFEDALVRVDQNATATGGVANLANWREGVQLNRTILTHVRQMRAYVDANLRPNARPEMGVPAVMGEMERLIHTLEAIPANVPPASPAGPLWDTNAWRNAVGRLQDHVSDSANRMIETLNRQTQSG